MFSVAKMLRMAHPLVSDHVAWPSPKLSNRPANRFHRFKRYHQFVVENRIGSATILLLDGRVRPQGSTPKFQCQFDHIHHGSCHHATDSLYLLICSSIYPKFSLPFSSQNLSQTKNPPLLSIFSKKKNAICGGKHLLHPLSLTRRYFLLWLRNCWHRCCSDGCYHLPSLIKFDHFHVSSDETLVTFNLTGWFIGILIIAYEIIPI